MRPPPAPISTFACTNAVAGRRVGQIGSGVTADVFGYNVKLEVTKAMIGTNPFGYACCMAVARRRCGMTLAELAATGGMNYGATAQAIRQFERPIRRNRAVRQAWTKIVNELNT